MEKVETGYILLLGSYRRGYCIKDITSIDEICKISGKGYKSKKDSIVYKAEIEKSNLSVSGAIQYRISSD